MAQLEHYPPEEQGKDVDTIFTLLTGVVDDGYELVVAKDGSVEIKDPDSKEVMMLVNKNEFEYMLGKFYENSPMTAEKISEIYKKATAKNKQL